MGAIVYDPMTGKFVSAQEAIADAAASGVATLTAGATTGARPPARRFGPPVL